VQAAARQPAQPPSAPADAGYAQRQEQALSETRYPDANAAELRKLMQQQQQSQQKPNFLQVRRILSLVPCNISTRQMSHVPVDTCSTATQFLRSLLT
jgi:hypothetical protein